MCDVHDVLHGDAAAGNEDEFILDTARVRAFIHETREAIAHTSSAVAACARIEPSFTSLLADEDWLPAEYQQDAPESGMGGGIGQWLLFRSHDRSLCLFSLVVPPGAMTPIHDHLAWGIIGLYRGSQDEEFYHPGHRTIAAGRRRPLKPGDHYTLLPPTDDVHRVRTTSEQTSVSIHLLANDTGCIERHTFDESTGEARPFVSGYVNAKCPAEPTPNCA
jgi:predicted metal-dependent enzyme (double-stranded beta helix superfamily)